MVFKKKAEKKIVVKEVKEEVPEVVKVVQQGDNIEFHLDADPNDPRNFKSGPLPSLDD